MTVKRVLTRRVVFGVTDHNVYLGRLILARQVDTIDPAEILIFYMANKHKESRR